MRLTPSRPLRARSWAAAGTLLPAALIAVIALTASQTADDCDDFGCASLGFAIIGLFAAVAAPVLAVLSQLATAGLGAVWPSLRRQPARLGLLAALLSWILLALVALLASTR